MCIRDRGRPRGVAGLSRVGAFPRPEANRSAVPTGTSAMGRAGRERHSEAIEVRQENAMKSMSRLLLSLAAVAACATAGAAPFDSADQARRDRNREEVMAKHGLNSSSADGTYRGEEKKTLKSESK